MRVRISSIKINPGRREAEPKAVEELARSIAAVGLLNPITLDQHNTLVAGLHRLEAAKLLGWTEIECTAIGMNTVQAELAETQKSLASAQEEEAAQAELAAEAQEASDLLSHRVDALYDLYALQQQYLLRDFEGCRETIQAMEDGGMVEFLSDGGAADVTSPALRYQQLKEAVSALDNRAP